MIFRVLISATKHSRKPAETEALDKGRKKEQPFAIFS